MELYVAVVFLSTQALERANLSSLRMVMGQDSQHLENQGQPLHWDLTNPAAVEPRCVPSTVQMLHGHDHVTYPHNPVM